MQLLFGSGLVSAESLFAITASRKIQVFIAARLQPKEAVDHTFRTTSCPSKHNIRTAPSGSQRRPGFLVSGLLNEEPKLTVHAVSNTYQNKTYMMRAEKKKKKSIQTLR